MSAKQWMLNLEQLKGKEVCYARADEKGLRLEFKGDYKLVVEEKGGPGLDSNWYNWVRVTLYGPGGWLIASWDMEA